jgi:hypothetical protein
MSQITRAYIGPFLPFLTSTSPTVDFQLCTDGNSTSLYYGSTPATQPPLGFLSAFLRSDLRAPATPPTSCDFNAADHSECPSARHPGVAENTLHPHQHLRCSEQHQQKPPKSHLYGSGSAMSQLGIKTAVPQLRPPECVPLLTRGDPSSAGGLLPPAGRLIFNFHRHDAQLGIKTAVPQLRPPACVPLLTRGGPSSAGSLLPPAGRLLFNFHGPDAQLGIKTAVSQLRPPACVPLLTRGGPSSAGGLLPPAGRLLSNFHGPDARFPAGMPWSGRHGVVAPLQLQGW